MQKGFKKGISSDKSGVGLVATYMKTKRGAKHSVHTIRAAGAEVKKTSSLTGVIFEPFSEVQNEFVQVSHRSGSAGWMEMNS
jgi:hypothetical protein